MAPSGSSGAATARRLSSFAACATLLLPGAWATTARAVAASSAAASVPASAPSAPLPCEATLRQMVDDALLSGPAGERKLVVFIAPPGRRLLPATGGATPEAAAVGQFGAKSVEGRCAYETTAYAATPFLILLAFLNMGAHNAATEKKIVALEKRLEALSPAQKEEIEDFFITGKAPKGTNPLSVLGPTQRSAPPLPPVGSQKVTAVKVTRRTSTQATMTLTGRALGTETVGGQTHTITVPFTESGIEASKIGGRWFLSGAQGMSFGT